MISSLFKAPNDMEHQLPNHQKDDGSLLSRLGLRDVIVFCSTRVWRGSSRLFLQVLGLILTLFIVVTLLPESMSSRGYKILSWSAEEPLPEHNLRIVVFGSPDSLGSAADASQARKTWTEELCDKLNCTTHISLVPSGEINRGLLSNQMYENEVQKLLDITKKTNIEEKPALDYNYIGEQYATPFEVPDLAAQVEQFLAMPQQETIPRETLWIFTFGTWDIWRMAAMPRKVSNELVDRMIEHIFAQAEVLYSKALDTKSIAFSDFWSNATDSQVKELTASGAIDKVDERKFESFRVLIPKLLDVSLTPGWTSRESPPFPNSIAEQQRNAAELTRNWNAAVEDAIESWKNKAMNSPAVAATPAGTPEETEEKADEEDKTGSQKEKRDGKVDQSASNNVAQEQDSRIIYAPYPLRNGLHLDPVKPIMEAMIEEEMQLSGIRDSLGRGTRPLNDSMRFIDVWTACVEAPAPGSATDGGEGHESCQTPDDHLFYDSFTINERAIKQVSKLMAADVMQNAFHQKEKSSWLSWK